MAAGRAAPSAAGSAVISAAKSTACESEESDALRWRVRDVRGGARPLVPRIQISSQSPALGQYGDVLLGRARNRLPAGSPEVSPSSADLACLCPRASVSRH